MVFDEFKALVVDWRKLDGNIELKQLKIKSKLKNRSNSKSLVKRHWSQKDQLCCNLESIRPNMFLGKLVAQIVCEEDAVGIVEDWS